MSDDTMTRSRRLTASAAAVVGFAVLGVGATGFALAQQETRTPPTVTDHSGHGGTAAPGPSPSPSGSPTAPAGDPHSGHGASAAPAPQYRTAQGPRLERSRPIRVTLPEIGASAPIIDLALGPDRRMEVPDNGTDAGWFTGSPTPGELGPAIIAAHVTHRSKPAVFFDLGAMRKGDPIEVTREDGTTATFSVTEVGQYPKSDFPSKKVYGSVDRAALRLITCGGVLDGETGSHVDNVVVYAQLTEAN
ncbi:class F sortase [Knoellia sp. CPCC 206435]|uniref:class F sortase n=1 Tax=Knoellia terrae TaxID=3404797 RepID=UPI003B437B74